jgi:hypothetical protein
MKYLEKYANIFMDGKSVSARTLACEVMGLSISRGKPASVALRIFHLLEMAYPVLSRDYASERTPSNPKSCDLSPKELAKLFNIAQALISLYPEVITLLYARLMQILNQAQSPKHCILASDLVLSLTCRSSDVRAFNLVAHVSLVPDRKISSIGVSKLRNWSGDAVEFVAKCEREMHPHEIEDRLSRVRAKLQGYAG